MQIDLFPHLVIEKRNNDFAFIDIADLDIFNGMKYFSFEELDNLLKNFTEEEIKDSIIRANIVPDVNVIEKKLCIKYGKIKLPVLTKDISTDFDLYEFIAANYGNKKMTNIFYNKIAAIVKSSERAAMFKDLLANASAEYFIQGLSWLSYTELRELYFYIYYSVAKKAEKVDNELKRKKVS